MPVVLIREAVPILLVGVGLLDQEPAALTLAGVGILVLVLSLALQLSSWRAAGRRRRRRGSGGGGRRRARRTEAAASCMVELLSGATVLFMERAHAVAEVKVKVGLSRTSCVYVPAQAFAYIVVKELKRRTVFFFSYMTRTRTLTGGRHRYLEQPTALGTSTGL